MGLGREYPYSEIGKGKCLVHESVANKLKIKKGDLIFADLYLNYTTLKILTEAYNYKNYGYYDKYISFSDAST